MPTYGEMSFHVKHRSSGVAGGNVVIIMRTNAGEAELAEVVRIVEQNGFRAYINPGVERKVVAALGEVDIDKVALVDVFANMPGVDRVQLISEPYKLSSRKAHPSPL